MSRGRAALLLIAINLALFAGLELVVRVGAWLVHERSPYFLLYGLDSVMADADPDGHSVAKAGYFKFPASRRLRQYGLFEEPTPIRINNLGFRGPDLPPRKHERVLRVVCLGGSSTFGFYARDPHTYPALLERRLEEAWVPPFRDVEVLNAGIPHARSGNILAMVEGEILDLEPDVLTFYSGYNDAVHVMDASPAQRAARWMHGHLATYVALKNLVSALGGPELHSRWATHTGAGPAAVERQLALHVQAYERNLRGLVRLARAHDVDLVLIRQPINAFHPQREGAYDELAERARRRLADGARIPAESVVHVVHRGLMDALQRVADAHGLPRVDFVPVVDETPELLASYVHLTEEGNAALAERLARAVAERLRTRPPGGAP